MAARDDMVIRPLLRRGRNKSVREKTRERAQEERRTSHEKRKQRRLGRRVRRARAARKAAQVRKAANAKAAKGGGVGKSAVKGALKGGAGAAMKAGGLILSIVAIVAEAIIVGGRAARRASGHSKRLVDATDADTLYGGMDEEIAADLAAVSFVEGNEDLLRIIGRQGKVNAQISDLLNEKRRMALMQIQGADEINRSPDLDAPETILDILIAKAHKAGIQGLADQAAEAIKTRAPHVTGQAPGSGR